MTRPGSPGPVLVGDIGGTNARFALAHEETGNGLVLDGFVALPADDFATFEAAAAAALDAMPVKPAAASFAVAGPVEAGRTSLTNRDWTLDAAAIAKRFGLASAALWNDFEALARGVPELDADAFSEILPGRARPDAPMVVGGPGTGFGMAVLVPSAAGWRVLKGEGGHQDFAPGRDVEWALAEALRPVFGHVSVEVVAAGKHAETVRRALFDVLGAQFETLAPDAVLARANAGDGPCAVYCEIRAGATLGALGDAALLVGGRGGAIVAGGVACALKPWLARPDAAARFRERGVMRDYLREVPVRLLEDASAPLIGAARLLEEMG